MEEPMIFGPVSIKKRKTNQNSVKRSLIDFYWKFLEVEVNAVTILCELDLIDFIEMQVYIGIPIYPIGNLSKC